MKSKLPSINVKLCKHIGRIYAHSQCSVDGYPREEILLRTR